MTIRAFSWAAVSSKPQAEGESLHDQHRLNHALSEALEWEILCDLTVPGETRSYYRLEEAVENLEAYQQLVKLAEQGNIDWLVCKSRDRLARTRRLNQKVGAISQEIGDQRGEGADPGGIPGGADLAAVGSRTLAFRSAHPGSSCGEWPLGIDALSCGFT